MAGTNAARGGAESKIGFRAKLTDLEIEILEAMAAEGMSCEEVAQAVKRRRA